MLSVDSDLIHMQIKGQKARNMFLKIENLDTICVFLFPRTDEAVETFPLTFLCWQMST